MAKNQMFLFWGSGSAPCWKPMIVLAEKGLWKDDMNKRLEFSKKEHKQSDVLALNPRGQLPTFKDGNVQVNESGAICMYVEEKYSNDSTGRLLPPNANERADVYQKMFEAANVISNIIEPLLRYRFMQKKEDWNQTHLEEGTKKAKEELDKWNTMLGDKPYLCGNDFTMADVFFYPFLAMMVRTGATLSGFPKLKEYYDRVSERPSVKATWPPHWHNSEGPGFLSDL
ncbi:glutathione S-transferase A-like [Mercenaria mercenaria]|uniref:glutathione S-transferase A-like n=1 Tax=Mercenaria mercenaria TaxID=6596 RepID=UPI00234E9AA3|nr:glutathione S-transferase A-like [Mercenaria mercenaria]